MWNVLCVKSVPAFVNIFLGFPVLEEKDETLLTVLWWYVPKLNS